MYLRILVPLDESELSEQVLPYARRLAAGIDARISLLHIIEHASAQLMGFATAADFEKEWESRASDTQDYLGKTSAALKETGVAADCVVREGKPASCIVDEAENVPGTLIAMSTHGRAGIARWTLGSVTSKVLHATTAPLLVVHPIKGNLPGLTEVKLETIITPLDGSPLAEQSLPHVAELAKLLSLHVVLLMVAPPDVEYGGWVSTSPVPTSAPYADIAKQVEAEASAYIEKIAQQLEEQGVSSIEKRILHGHAASTIVDLAMKTPNSMVAITSHGRSAIGRWALGSVADRIVRHAGKPVLITRAKKEGTQ